MERSEIAAAIVATAGPAVRLIESGNGWPSILEVDSGGTPTRVSAFLGIVHSMSRKAHERRFQNPSGKQPIVVPPGTHPMLLGWSEEFGRPVLVSADAIHRIGLGKRNSYLHPASLLQRATFAGWATFTNSKGEEYLGLWPGRLPIAVARRTEGLVLPETTIVTMSHADGPHAVTTSVAAETAVRERALVSRLIRDARFSKMVLSPYSGRCALTGIGLGAVVGAHIYPASAPGSPDSIPNGIALTETVHRIFDAHRLFIHPKSLKVSVHPELIEAASRSPHDRAFLKMLRPSLLIPSDSSHRPDPAMFTRRYKHFEGQYAWAS